MRTAEIYKLRTHRTPLICAAALLVGVLTPSVVLTWYTPTDTAAYTDAYIAAFEVLSILLAIVFGGWFLGTEYRQGTVKRLLTSEPRRKRALAVKGFVGLAAMQTVLMATASIGWAAARVVGSMNDVTVPWHGVDVLAFCITAAIAGTMAYSLSAITRSDTFAMVGVIVIVVVMEPLLGLIPKIGHYTIGSVIVTFEQSITGETSEQLTTLSNGGAAITLAVWFTAFLGAAAALFSTRDV